MSSVHIGSRWTPAHIVRRDDELGLYSEVNSPLITKTERDTQTALLSPVRSRITEQRIAQAQSATRLEQE